MRSRPTIKDVALRAGVSKATVSFVLSENPNQSISEAVKKRVFAAAKELRYHRRATAVGLAEGRTRNLSVVFSWDMGTVSNPFYSHVLEGVIEATIEQNYNLLFSYILDSYRGPQDLPKIIREQNTEGVLLFSRINPKMVRDVQALGLPTLGIDTFPNVPKLESFRSDDAQGGRIAAEHLLELGHKRIGVLGAGIDRPSVRRRYDAFEETLMRSGLVRSEAELLLAGDLSSVEGYQRGKQLFQAGRPPFTAIFCLNDELGVGLLRAAHEAGVRVPAELSVIGFDDIMVAREVFPQLSTVGVDKKQLGKASAQRLLEMLEEEAPGPGRERLIPVRLVVRESTAPHVASAAATEKQRRRRTPSRGVA